MNDEITRIDSDISLECLFCPSSCVRIPIHRFFKANNLNKDIAQSMRAPRSHEIEEFDKFLQGRLFKIRLNKFQFIFEPYTFKVYPKVYPKEFVRGMSVVPLFGPSGQINHVVWICESCLKFWGPRPERLASVYGGPNGVLENWRLKVFSFDEFYSRFYRKEKQVNKT